MNWATGVGLALSLWALIEAIHIWWRYDLRWITKVKFSLVGTACAFVSWFAVHWHLIGPRTASEPHTSSVHAHVRRASASVGI